MRLPGKRCASCHSQRQAHDRGHILLASGFTVLEMLVVLSLLAIFAVTLAGSLHFGVKAEGAVSSRAVSTDALQRAEKFLRERLNNAHPVWIRSDNRGWVDFDGSQNEMAFLAPTLECYGGVGLSRFKLTVDTDGSVSRLTAAASTAPPKGQEPKLLGATVLVNNSLSIRFAYYGKVDGGAGMAWQSNWHQRTEMPDWVWIRAVNSGANQTAVVDLVARPRIDIDVECRLDFETATCIGH